MRLLTLFSLLLLSLTLSAQACVEGDGPLTSQTVREASCLDYRTTLTLADGQRYTVALSASTDSIAVVQFVPGKFLGRETWSRTTEHTRQAVFMYNEHLSQIQNN